MFSVVFDPHEHSCVPDFDIIIAFLYSVTFLYRRLRMYADVLRSPRTQGHHSYSWQHGYGIANRCTVSRSAACPSCAKKNVVRKKTSTATNKPKKSSNYWLKCTLHGNTCCNMLVGLHWWGHADSIRSPTKCNP